MRGHSQVRPVFVGKSISDGSSISVTEGFLLGGRGIRRLIFDLHLTLTKVSGSSAVADGDLKYIRSMSLRDNRGNVYVNDVPGVFLYRRNKRLSGVAARRTAIAAASATYSTMFIVDFSNPRNARPDDTILDTNDVSQLSLSLSFGSINDLLTVSGDTLSVTLDCYQDVTSDTLPKPGVKGATGFVQTISCLPQVDPSAVTVLDVPPTDGEYVRALHILTCNSGSAYRCAGTPAANILAKLMLKSNASPEWEETLVGTVAGLNKSDFQEETIETGLYTMELNQGRSIMECMQTDQRQVQLAWTTDTLSTSRVNVLQERIMARK